MDSDTLRGSLWILFLYDVSEEIRLDDLPQALGGRVHLLRREPSFRGPTPEYVRFEKPPVGRTGSMQLDGDLCVSTRVNYYEYGVVSLALEVPFQCSWRELVGLASRTIASNDLERRARGVLEEELRQISSALVDPYEQRLSEDYCLIHVRPLLQKDGGNIAATEVIREHGAEIAQMVRGETHQLSQEETLEVLQSRMSYYPDDLLVVGWTAAFLYETPEGAVPILQLVEYANSQLLDFRHYDEVLTRVLVRVYKTLDRKRTLLARWRLAREAEELNTIRLDIEELTEKMDNSIKFLSDMFWARVYRLAAAKIGVVDYRALVAGKLKTAADLYRSMMDQFQDARAFVLELTIVIILLIELFYLFRGMR